MTRSNVNRTKNPFLHELTFNSIGDFMYEWIYSMNDLQGIQFVLCFTNNVLGE